MGAGKSTVGRVLAERLALPFVETDALIVEQAGRSIPEVFAAEGEPGFRDRETAVLRSLAGTRDAVIATGGGILGREMNRRLLRELGTVVYLRARPETILARLAADGPPESRPMLAGDPQGRVRALLAERTPLYEQADLTVDTDGLSAEAVVHEIVRRAEGAIAD
jgi:shikimate kinase